MSDARGDRPLLLGHRGARAEKSIPENTLASFDRALSDGCDGFEFDVRLAADGTAVVCHDPLTKNREIVRTTGRELAHLPMLEEVLIRYQSRAFLDIELKVAGVEEAVAEMLRKYPPARGFVVSSFIPEVLQSLHHKDNAIPLGLICEKKSELKRWNELPVEYVIPHYELANGDLIGEMRAKRKKIVVWTVNQKKDIRRFAKLGVDGIISDDTKLLCKTLG